MQRRPQPTRRLLNLENLEGRALLAGNVTAAVVEGKLTVVGDDLANGVIIRMAPLPPGSEIDPENPPPLKLEIVGTRTAGELATTVNGNEKFVAEGVTAGISISLGKGNDVLTIANPPPPAPAEGEPTPPPPPPVNLPGEVRINLGDGSDRMKGNIKNAAGIVVVLGSGNDQLTLGGSQLNNVQIFGDVPPPPESSSAGPTTPPPGSDRLEIVNTRVAGTARIDMGIGDDGAVVRGRSSFAKGLSISTGGGNDGVQIQGLPAREDKPALPVNIQGRLQVNLGAGNDRASLGIVQVAGVAAIDAGAGNDEVNLDGVRARDGLFALLGLGDDKLSVKRCSSSSAQFSGGDGTDLFTNLGGNEFTAIEIEGFEDPDA